jgi:hypothetical protein
VPHQIEHRDTQYETAYSRLVDGRRFELVNSPAESFAFRDGELLFRCPKGIRVVTDREGNLVSLIGMSVNTIDGSIWMGGQDLPFRIAANEQLELNDGELVSVRMPGLVPPSY